MNMERCNDTKLIDTLTAGGITVFPSDTLYGVMARADNKEAVERLYEVKRRAPGKACIVLVADTSQLEGLGLHVPLWAEVLLERAWPGPLSIAFEVTSLTPEYIHRGVGSVAVRLPDDEDLRCLIRKTGPLVAPSANPEGLPPATTVHWAKEYFGDLVDYYFDGGPVSGQPSTVISLGDHDIDMVREGAADVSMLRDLVRRV